MKKIIFSTVIIFIALSCVQAQHLDLAQIKKKYYALKNDISGLKTASYTGKYYCLELNDNIYGGSYPGIGAFSSDVKMYHQIDENDEGYPWDAWRLEMVIVNEKRAANTTYKEYMFHNNKLVFAYIKDAYNENIEQRLYCSDGKVLLYTENNQSKETPEEVQPILDDAAYYLKSFLAIKQR